MEGSIDMAGPEKTFENRIKRFLDEKGCWYVKTWGGGYQRSGLPDLMACIGGRFVGIEVKSENGRLSKLQEHELRKIRCSGGHGIVLYPKDFEGFKEFVEKLLIDN